MNKLLLSAAVLVILGSPATAQVQLTDEMIAITAVVVTYSKECRGEIKPEYQRAARDVIARGGDKFKQMLDTVSIGFANQGVQTFCARTETSYAKFLDFPSYQPGELPACGSSEAISILKRTLHPIDGVGDTQDMGSDNPDKRWCRTKLNVRYSTWSRLVGWMHYNHRWTSFTYTIEWTNKSDGRYWVQAR